MEESAYRSLIDSLLLAVEPDDRIQAVLIYGSHASGKADAFSDLDIGLVTTDAAYDEVVANADAIVHALGEPLFLEHFDDPSNLHAILADGSDLELIINCESELRLEGPHRVLVDRARVVERARERPAAESPGASADQIQRRIQGFWHDVGHLVTALARGNTWWAFGQLDELRRMCIDLARLDAGSPPEDEAYWKVDEALPGKRLSNLRATVAPPQLRPMRDAALATLDLYRDLATDLAARYGVTYPTELDRLLSARLKAVMADDESA